MPEDKGERVEEKRLTSPQSVESMEFTEEQLNCIGQNKTEQSDLSPSLTLKQFTYQKYQEVEWKVTGDTDIQKLVTV